MTPYEVEWRDEASAELADIWTRAIDRKAVTAADARISGLLRRDPHNNGTHRSEGLYRLEVTPLVVTYSIDDAARRVDVSWVWYVP